MELWGESILTKLLKQVGYVIKIDIDSEDVSKGRFARVCVEVDISKPLKIEIKNKMGNIIKSALINYENLTDIYYGCDQQDHKFENCPLFPKSFSIKIEKRLMDPIFPNQVPSQNSQDLPMAMIIGLKLNPNEGKGLIWENPIKELQRILMQVPRTKKTKERSKDNPNKSLM